MEINGDLFWMGWEVDINSGEGWRESTGGAMGVVETRDLPANFSVVNVRNSGLQSHRVISPGRRHRTSPIELRS